MKLVVLKLISLMVFLGGITLLGLNFGCGYVEHYWAAASVFVGTCPVCATVGFSGMAGVVMAVAGLYGFLPAMKRKRRITCHGPEGETTIELKPMEARLVRIMGAMPEVKRIKIRLLPDRKKRRVIIQGRLVQRHVADVSAREVRDRISHYLHETAVVTLGLDIVEPIQLVVEGVEVNPKAAGKALREKFTAPALVRMESEEITLPESVPAPVLLTEAPDAGVKSPLLAPLALESVTAEPDMPERPPVAVVEADPVPGESSRSDFDLLDPGERSPFDTLGAPLVKDEDEDKDNGAQTKKPLP